MKAIIRDYKPDTEKKNGLTREMKRRLAKQLHMSMKQVEKIFADATVDYHYDTLIEGSKVKLNYDAIMEKKELKSEMFLKFVEDHKDDILTIEYDPKYGESPSIFCLAEDDNELKWTFDISELELVEMGVVSESYNEAVSESNDEVISVISESPTIEDKEEAED